MEKISLVVLAAGMGSRYGGLKQLDGVGPSGQTIMDYSVHDAISAGFNHVIFVIRRDFQDDFKEKIISKYADRIACDIAFQDMNACTEDIAQSIIDARLKPWGTAHATLVAKDKIEGPFAVINADDFYGRDAFNKMYAFLRNECTSDHYAMIGYELDKTLSANGVVNRGICSIENDYLTRIVEGLKISKSNGHYAHQTPNETLDLKSDTLVSMNFFGFHPSILDHMKIEFITFAKASEDDPKSEYFIPLVLDNMMNQDKIKVKVIPTDAEWIGVTYQEDKEGVMSKLMNYTQEGIYAAEF